MEPGLTLVSSSWSEDGSGEEGWKPGLKLINAAGEVRHEWRIDPVSVFPDSSKRRGIRMEDFDIQGSYLFDDGDVVVNVEYLGAARLNSCSEVVWTLAEGNHHSIARDEDGSFWIPGVSRSRPPSTSLHPDGLPGLRGNSYQDEILRISEDGRVLERITVLDILYANDLERYIIKAGQVASTDITHVNDVEPLTAAMAEEFPLFEPGDLLVSLRNLHLVFVFDPATLMVKWHSSDPFLHQHDPDFLAGGWIGVFDNNTDLSTRGTVLGGSRIFGIQPHTDSTRVFFPTERSEPFYTSVRGKWQRLENGNMLLTESAAGRVVEVTPDGRTVWDWVVDPYDGDRVPYVSTGLRVDLEDVQLDSWPCSRLSSDQSKEAIP